MKPAEAKVVLEVREINKGLKLLNMNLKKLEI
jgi:hypothetical protein